jgi:hypothetical protein
MSLTANIPVIMERFDFHLVKKVMDFLEWSWADHNRVPTVPELQAQARGMLHEVIQYWKAAGSPDTGMELSTGGFVAEVSVFGSGKPQLKLTFYLEQRSSAI